MAGIDEVLERLLTDAQFARHLAQDPASALAGYELTTDDLTLLSTQVSFDPGALSLVEERISKSSFFGLVTSFTGGLAAGGGVWQPEGGMSPEVVAPVDSEGVIGPSDSEGVAGPIDGQVPAVQNPDGSSFGDGSDVSIREAAVAPEPSPEGGGGGAGGEVSIKEVDPAPQPTIENFPTPITLSEPEGGLSGADGVVVQGGLTDALGVVVQGGLTDADAVVVQGGLTPPDGTVFEGNMTPPDGTIVPDGSSAPDVVVVQGGLTESEAVTYPI